MTPVVTESLSAAGAAGGGGSSMLLFGFMLLLIIGIDQFLDMGRSATNVIGNSLAAAVVGKWEGDRTPGPGSQPQPEPSPGTFDEAEAREAATAPVA